MDETTKSLARMILRLTAQVSTLKKFLIEVLMEEHADKSPEERAHLEELIKARLAQMEKAEHQEALETMENLNPQRAAEMDDRTKDELPE